MHPRPIINRRRDGEYSTVVLSDGTIETMWFGNDGEQRLVARHCPKTPADIARIHVEGDEYR